MVSSGNAAPPGAPAAKTVLVVDDEKNIRRTLQLVLEGEGYQFLGAETAEQALAILASPETPVDLAIFDVKLPQMSGLEAIERLRRDDVLKDTPIIVISGHASVSDAVQAIKLGASDFFEKPLNRERVLVSVANVLQAEKTRRVLAEVSKEQLEKYEMIGRAPAIRKVFHEIEKVAPTKAGVLITGESGTGKELISRAIHRLSPRTDGPFVKVNCAAIPRDLIESELFGHERGAFTGTDGRRIGRFEQANGGTLFLDEIGDLTPSTQAKLVRVLQEKSLQRLGGKETITVDVRVVAATHRDLEAAMRQKQFRDDLYYRLSTVEIALPALRNRREDIPDLIRHFLRKHGVDFGDPEPSIGAEAIDFLQEQAWPGNVRELENAVRKLLLLARGFTINLDHVRAALSKSAPPAAGPDGPFGDYVDDLLAAAQRGELDDAHARALGAAERELFSRAIRLAQGNQSRAARWLGVSRITMKAKLIQFGIHPGREEAPPERPA